MYKKEEGIQQAKLDTLSAAAERLRGELGASAVLSEQLEAARAEAAEEAAGTEAL
eukprot:SAG11_NODE_11982_length_728_cov_0.643879_1_plen_54_part_10